MTILRLSFLLVVILLGGCAGSGGGPDRWRAFPHDPGIPRADGLVAGERCPGDDDAEPGGTFRLALAGTVDPAHAPVPATAAEKHVFRNLYETLVRIDCNGEAVPALAASWAAFGQGRTWVLRLRPRAAYWDGTPVRAADVIAGWPRNDNFSAVAAGPDTLILHLRTASDTLPLDLADPALAVARRVGGGWPQGTGACQPAPGEELVLIPNTRHPRPAIAQRVSIVLAADVSCELLEAQADAVVVAATCPRRPGVRTLAMPWDLVYLLVVPTGEDRSIPERARWATGYHPRELAGPGLEEAESLFLIDPAESICDNLPVRVRPLDWPSFTWPGATASRDRELILYPDDDAVAAALASAIAELANIPRRPAPDMVGRGPLTPEFPAQGGAAPTAAAVPPQEFPGALQSGLAGAYVVPWPRRAATTCGDLGALLGLAEWLQVAAFASDTVGDAVPPSARAADPFAAEQWIQAERIARRLQVDQVVTPLLRARGHLATTAGLVGLTWDFDGALDLSRAGWATRP